MCDAVAVVVIFEAAAVQSHDLHVYSGVSEELNYNLSHMPVADIGKGLTGGQHEGSQSHPDSYKNV